jgi:uncharacterized protein DUF929
VVAACPAGGGEDGAVREGAAGAPLTSRGKPEILYVGAGYCPYCATERWPLAVALSRFGTFTGRRGIHSSATDVYPSQPTPAFAHSSYTWAQVAAALHDPGSPIAQGADGAANMITAAICKITGNQPARVCGG